MNSPSRPLLIVGAGGHGSEVLAYCREMGQPVLGFLDDRRPVGAWAGAEVLGDLQSLPQWLQRYPNAMVHVAIGNNAIRRALVGRVQAMGLGPEGHALIAHPDCRRGVSVEVGEGTLLAPASVLTTRLSVGRHCIVNIKASVSHDAVVGDFCNLNPGAILCGSVVLGEGVSIGAGAVVIEGRRVGANTVVGAGAVVVSDLPEGVVAVGVPARILRRLGD